MKPLKNFEEFLSLGVVRKQNIDKERAKNLILEAEKRLEFFDKIKKKIGDEEMSPNYIVETCYDILIEMIRAKLLIEGYNSGNSHEAEVSYMKNLGFLESEVYFMNELRYFRNGIKYYGKIIDKEYAEKVLDFVNRIYPRLKTLVKI